MSGEAQPQDVLGFPTLHQLRAALRIGRVLNAPAGTLLAACREAHARTPSNGVFSSGDFERGQTILADAGLLRLAGDLVLPEEALGALLALPEDEACRCLIERIIEASPPLWLSAATCDGVLAGEFVPSAVAQSLEELIPDLDRREAFLLTMGDRFTDDDNRQVGELAEVCVVDRARHELEAAGRDDLARQIRRVSLASDALGYDVTAPRDNGTTRRLEVKGTRGEGQVVSVVISRNEANTAGRDPDWFLVACRVAADDFTTVIGWAAGGEILPNLPQDPPSGGKWRAATIFLDAAELHPGLPTWQRAVAP